MGATQERVRPAFVLMSSFSSTNAGRTAQPHAPKCAYPATHMPRLARRISSVPSTRAWEIEPSRLVFALNKDGVRRKLGSGAFGAVRLVLTSTGKYDFMCTLMQACCAAHKCCKWP